MAGLLDRSREIVTDQMEKPEAKVTHVGLKDVNLEYVTYNAKVSVTNPYTTPLPILQISYALKSANRDIASGTTSGSGGSLKGNNTTVLDVELKVQHSVLLSLAREIAADWDSDYELGVNFVLNVPIDYELVIDFVLDVPVFGNLTISILNEGKIKFPTFSDLSTLMKVRLLLLLGTSTPSCSDEKLHAIQAIIYTQRR
ncbi:desiccation protectant protein Lea14-like [Heracleum sosnowskyi]|uniref:Desiccation protectant protein Lea14-like n=1 Tax=Heracleum sosnowskyi TaxID=360622 RepID=A0AAD8HB45_9APIA|nr:desiccation protectant protein Lea14-like [Heracleum sosnowskyi]